MGRHPGDEVRHLLRAEWCPMLSPPVRHSEIRATGDHRGPQRLIAHKSEIRRIDDVVALRAAVPFGAMAARAGCRIDAGASARIAQGCCVGRWRRTSWPFGT